jgi:hypothetical protein
VSESASSTGPMLVATDDLHPMATCRTSSVGSGYRTSPTNCDDPVHGSSPGETHLLWGPGESLPTLKAGPEKMKSLLHGHRYQTLFSWFRVQNKPYHCMITEQALPLYDPVHGSGPGEMVFRHMSVVQRGVQSRATTAGNAVWTALGLVYVSGTDCGEMCSLDSLGRLVRPRSGRKTRRLWPQTADFIRYMVVPPCQ